MKTLIKMLILFLIITIASTILINSFGVEFGETNFWEVHGVLFLVFITIFPRLTLLFSSVAFGGLFWWLGFIFAPRFLVAILATIAYWHTNKILVIISWLFAIGGESSEKYYVHRYTVRRNPGRSSSGNQNNSSIDKDVIEAEYYEVEK
jgi:hypothetical protein